MTRNGAGNACGRSLGALDMARDATSAPILQFRRVADVHNARCLRTARRICVARGGLVGAGFDRAPL